MFGDFYTPEDLFTALSIMLSGGELRGEDIGTDKIILGDKCYLIDTCFTLDTGKYETAIGIHNLLDWVIVETYDTFEEAREGHAKWCSHINTEKPLFFYDVHVNQFFGVIEDNGN